MSPARLRGGRGAARGGGERGLFSRGMDTISIPPDPAKDTMTSSLLTDLRERVIDEVLLAYRFNTELFEDLDRARAAA